jgi:putative DNA methylase
VSGYRKKLIEVGLPLVAINAESAREKSIRHGHPSTLHLWWARRPLAACRAVLFASLVDDPDSDPQYRKADGTVDEDRAGIKRADLFNLIEELVMWENSNNVDVIRTARSEIARCVASRLIETGALNKDAIVANKTTAWDLVIRGHCRPMPMGLDKKAGRVRFSFDVSRLASADVVNKFLSEHAPPVLDPFAGGGSIPMEAQRLGLRAYASDLNPVPVLINKALIEIPPKFAGRPPVNPESRGEGAVTKGKGKKGKALVEKEWQGATGLAEDVRYYGQWMRDEAEKRIGHLYPKVEVTTEMAQDRPDLLPFVGQQLTAIAWLWARTVASPNPACGGAHVPLVKSFNISTRSGKQAFVEPVIDRQNNSVEFHVHVGRQAGSELRTIGRRGGTCLLSGAPIPFDYIRKEGKAGRIGVTLLAIVAIAGNERVYLSPNSQSQDGVINSDPQDVPDGEMAHNPFSLRPPLYGFRRFADIFTERQLVALTTFSDLVSEARELVCRDSVATGMSDDHQRLADGGTGAAAYADSVATYLSFAVSRGADYWSTGATWEPSGGFVGHTFSKQALPMVWDYCESNPIGDSSGNWSGAIDWIARVVDRSFAGVDGVASQLNATELKADNVHYLISTDPPYYNNVDYADLSDYFYIWLRRSIGRVYPSLFGTLLTPKTTELVASQYRFEGDKAKSRDFFESGLQKAFRNLKRMQPADMPMTVYYAFRQAEAENSDEDDDVGQQTEQIVSTGWETMLSGLINAGFAITGTWPMRTERSARSMSINMNALASSVVLVCRPRPTNASLATRKDFITALRQELPEALRNLQRGNIAPVDLAQAAIGPGMGVFTRYAKVLESDGSAMTVRTALGLINQTLDEVLAEQEGEFDGDTRWALAWFEQFGMDEGPFGDAETLSKAKNTAVNGLVEAGIVAARAGKVRLVKRDELSVEWNPATDKRLTIWEITQHLIQRLDQQGESGAATLVRQLGGTAEVARDLAYRLYSTCERKKWAQEALAYNSLVVAWSELTKLALVERGREREQQQGLF